MVAVVYSRVSSEDQARTGFSLASQVESGRRRAADLGATDVVLFADEGVPGDVVDRPGLQAALEAVRRGGVALFICYDPDRLARSLSLQLVVTDQIERAGTRLEFVNFEYKNTPEGQLFYSLRGAIAQFEKAKIMERTMRGKRQKAKAGGLTHNPNIFGYSFDPVSDTLTVDPTQAAVVRMIFEWFLTGDDGPWLIAQRLTDLGFGTQRGAPAWHHSSVRNILKNESYTGKFHLQKWDYSGSRLNKYRPKGEKIQRKLREETEWLAVEIPAIIDEETFRAAQAKMENARRWWSGWHREEYLISGLAVCATCGRPIYGASRQSGKKRIRYYVCRGYAPGVPGQPRCKFGRVRADEIEAEAWQEVRDLILIPGRLQEIFQRQFDSENLHSELAIHRQQLAEAQAEHERTVRLVVRGSVAQELGDQLLKEQRERIARVKDHIRRIEGQLSDVEGVLAQSQAAEELRKKWEPVVDSLPFDGRQRAVRAFVKSIVLSRDETVIHARLASLTPRDSPGEAV